MPKRRADFLNAGAPSSRLFGHLMMTIISGNNEALLRGPVQPTTLSLAERATHSLGLCVVAPDAWTAADAVEGRWVAPYRGAYVGRWVAPRRAPGPYHQACASMRLADACHASLSHGDPNTQHILHKIAQDHVAIDARTPLNFFTERILEFLNSEAPP